MGKKKKKGKGGVRLFGRRFTFVSLAFYAAMSLLGGWYASHPLAWLEEKRASWPAAICAPLEWFGDRALLVTDGLGWTGHDAVYEYDEPPPANEVFFAGAPKRVGAPAPTDVQIMPRGEFTVGYSRKLGHAVWVGYHVPAEAAHEAGKRPSFRRDPEVPNCPSADAYARSGYDRGHLAPNHAIATRFGPDEQRKTFLMTNVAPQSPSLNRGPWRFVERAIADVWTRRYGEIWVVAGTIPSSSGERVSGTEVDVPDACWQVIAAQTADGVRAMAFVMPQTIRFGAFPVHHLVTVDELERLTGLDFFPELPGFLQEPLEADLPTRLWPVDFFDVFRLMALRFT
ncbi:MAG: DNA/RNA non-specific endonuclease [Kiritimatiellae bacterium]|nr:DNA/RNA non-specific endonuclease [Kiritimatiellia bacterium]